MAATQTPADAEAARPEDEKVAGPAGAFWAPLAEAGAAGGLPTGAGALLRRSK